MTPEKNPKAEGEQSSFTRFREENKYVIWAVGLVLILALVAGVNAMRDSSSRLEWNLHTVLETDYTASIERDETGPYLMVQGDVTDHDFMKLAKQTFAKEGTAFPAYFMAADASTKTRPNPYDAGLLMQVTWEQPRYILTVYHDEAPTSTTPDISEWELQLDNAIRMGDELSVNGEMPAGIPKDQLLAHFEEASRLVATKKEDASDAAITLRIKNDKQLFVYDSKHPTVYTELSAYK